MSATATQTSVTTTLSGAQDSTYVPRGPVSTKLNFFREPEDGSKPHNFVEKQPEGRPQRNFGETVVEVQMNDIRDRENEFWLDKDAFLAIKGVPSEETEFLDDEHIKQVYYPEVEKLLLERVPGHTKSRSSTTLSVDQTQMLLAPQSQESTSIRHPARRSGESSSTTLKKQMSS